MKILTPDFTLTSIRVQPQNSVDKPLDPAGFTDRSDFVFFHNVYNLHIKLSFINESHFRLPRHEKGTQRNLSIALLDIKQNKVLASGIVHLTIPADQAIVDMVCTLPLDYITIDPANTHQLIVRDLSTDKIIGTKDINWYRLSTIRRLPTKWYKPLTGYICRKSDLNSAPYVCLAADDNEILCVKFKIEAHFDFGKDKLPEVEIRLYEPDGHSYSSVLCSPYRERYDGAWTYTVDMQFTTGMRNRGVHYADLLVTGYSVCGFVFTTTGPSIEGRWTDKHLSYITDHSPEYLGVVYDARISEKLHEQPDADAVKKERADIVQSMLEEFMDIQAQEFPHASDIVDDDDMRDSIDNENCRDF